MSMGYTPRRIHKIGDYAICMSVERDKNNFEEVRKVLEKRSMTIGVDVEMLHKMNYL